LSQTPSSFWHTLRRMTWCQVVSRCTKLNTLRRLLCSEFWQTFCFRWTPATLQSSRCLICLLLFRVCFVAPRQIRSVRCSLSRDGLMKLRTLIRTLEYRQHCSSDCNQSSTRRLVVFSARSSAHRTPLQNATSPGTSLAESTGADTVPSICADLPLSPR